MGREAEKACLPKELQPPFLDPGAFTFYGKCTKMLAPGIRKGFRHEGMPKGTIRVLVAGKKRDISVNGRRPVGPQHRAGSDMAANQGYYWPLEAGRGKGKCVSKASTGSLVFSSVIYV